MKKFEEQIDEIRVPCIIDYFKDKNLLNFLKMHINIDNLLQSYKNKSKNPNETKSLYEKLIDIETLTDDILIKELISTIKMQISDVPICENVVPSIKLDNMLLERLNKLFPTSNIEIDVDENFNIFKLKENNKPDIYIYSHILDINISNETVDKFCKSIKERNCCGILCNRNYGIYNKSLFEIDFQDNNVNILYKIIMKMTNLI
jgi:hypothetical protein